MEALVERAKSDEAHIAELTATVSRLTTRSVCNFCHCWHHLLRVGPLRNRRPFHVDDGAGLGVFLFASTVPDCARVHFPCRLR